MRQGFFGELLWEPPVGSGCSDLDRELRRLRRLVEDQRKRDEIERLRQELRRPRMTA